MIRTLAQWRALADGGILWRADDDLAERAKLLDKVAACCVDLETTGGPANLWHAISIVTSTPCQCAVCNPPKGRKR